MPNLLDASGLQTATRDELIARLTTAYKAIYGQDINLSSSTPDGQMMNIYVQTALDIEDLITQVYNSFDPDKAIGVVLDSRVAINGIQRQAGTYTITPITVVTSQSVNLYGLDQSVQPVYTIADNAGNQWNLVSTVLGLAAGTTVLSFRAAIPGAQLTIPNTITVPVTIVLGVTSVNNPAPYSQLGVNEESDALLRIRRQKSVSLASQGYIKGLLAALQNVPGVSGAYVYENNQGVTNVDGVPGNSIWVIIAGNPLAADVAWAIYTKRGTGAGMYGAQQYNVSQPDGTTFLIKWDNVVTRNLYIAFTVTSKNGITPPSIAAILAALPNVFVPDVYSQVDINMLATRIQAIDPNTLVTAAGFSQGTSEIATLSGVAASGSFQVVYNGNASAAILWNDSAATIQTKLQAVSGLTGILVTGSIASQTLTFDLTAVGNIATLLYVQNNSLLTAGAVPITFAWNENYQPTLTPLSKQNQFVVTASRIIILPMQLQASAASVPATVGSATFTPLGGYSVKYTFSMQANPSGGSVNATTGVYTAGGLAGQTDIVKVTDAFGNTATAQIQTV